MDVSVFLFAGKSFNSRMKLRGGPTGTGAVADSCKEGFSGYSSGTVTEKFRLNEKEKAAEDVNILHFFVYDDICWTDGLYFGAASK